MERMRFLERDSLEWKAAWGALRRGGYLKFEGTSCEVWQYMGTIVGEGLPAADVHQFRHRDYPGLGRLYFNVRCGQIIELAGEPLTLPQTTMDRLLVHCWVYGVGFDCLTREQQNTIRRETWKLQDGYGEVGHMPPQGWDWSGIRDSSSTALSRMAVEVQHRLSAWELVRQRKGVGAKA